MLLYATFRFVLGGQNQVSSGVPGRQVYRPGTPAFKLSSSTVLNAARHLAPPRFKLLQEGLFLPQVR